MNPLFQQTVSQNIDAYRAFPAHAEIFLKNDQPYTLGELFHQTDAADALQYIVDEETKALAEGGRGAGLRAARHAFYQGDIMPILALSRSPWRGSCPRTTPPCALR